MMTKEVTFTNCKVAKIEMKDGAPTITKLPDFRKLGNFTEEKALKVIQKFEPTATVYDYNLETVTYEMPVEEFIKYATIKTTDNNEELEDEE